MCIAAAVMTNGCADEYSDYYTSAEVNIVAGDTVSILQMQGTCTVTCLSNEMSWQSSTWNGTTASFERLMRGPYSILVTGTAAISVNGGAREVHSFRASSSYTEFLDHPSSVDLPMHLLQ